MSKTLSNRQMQRYKKLLEVKVASLGIKDEITYRPTGRAKLIPISDGPVVRPKDPKQITPEWIKAHFNEVPTSVAQNCARNLVKRMLKMEPSVIEAFLKADLRLKKEEPPSAVLEIGKEPDVKVE